MHTNDAHTQVVKVLSLCKDQRLLFIFLLTNTANFFFLAVCKQFDLSSYRYFFLFFFLFFLLNICSEIQMKQNIWQGKGKEPGVQGWPNNT